MKKSFLNTVSFFFILPVIALLAGCEKDAKVEQANLSVSVKEVYADAAKIAVTTDSNSSTFYFNVIEKSGYTTDEEIIARDLNAFNAKAAESGKDLAYVINSEISVGNSEKLIEGLKNSTAYYAYAYVLNSQGETGEILVKQEFTTKEVGSVNSLFRITIDDIYGNGATVMVEPKQEGLTFYYTVMSEVVFKKHGGNGEGIAEYLAEDIRSQAEEQEISIEEMVDKIAHTAKDVYYYQTLDPETKYYACVVSINKQAEALAKAEYEAFSTTESTAASEDFEIMFTEITTNSTLFLITPNEPAMLYYMGVVKCNSVDRYKNDEEYMQKFIEDAGFLFPMMLTQGESEGNYEDLLPDTEYYAIAFGTDETTYTTKLFKSKFRTQVGYPLDKFEVQIDIMNVSSSEIKCEMYPNSTDYRFMYDAMPFYYHKEGMTQEDLQNYVNVITDYYMAIMPDNSMEDILKYYLSARGNNRITFRNLAPDIDYYIWAAAIDMDGQIISDYNMIKVHTKKAVAGQGYVEVSLRDVFKGDDVANLLPEIFYDATGSAVAIFDMNLVQVDQELVYCVFEGDLSKYEDDLCITNLQEQGTFCKPDTKAFAMRMEWDTDYTVLAMAKDKNGDWGKLTRYPVYIDKNDPVTPITEFPVDMFYETSQEEMMVPFMLQKQEVKMSPVHRLSENIQ